MVMGGRGAISTVRESDVMGPVQILLLEIGRGLHCSGGAWDRHAE